MKDFLRNNGIWILLIAVSLTAILGIFSALFGGIANPLANLWGIVTTPIREVSNTFITWTEGVYNYSFRYEELEEENKALQKRVAELERQAAEGELTARENERLRALLGLQEKRSDFVFEAATVVSRSASNWESSLTINKGSIQDVAPGDCVIDENGALVGVVTQVGLNWSAVRTIIDADTELGGLVTRTDSAAIAEGDFALMEEGKLKLTYLPENTQLIAGDLVLTSGLNGTYPSGLVIGAIEELRTEASGMSGYAILSPRVDLPSLKQVFVIKDFDIVE